MQDLDKQYFNILVVGSGQEYFQPVVAEETSTFQDSDLYIGIGEGFSALEITQVIISIGSNVIAGLSVYYIAKIFDKIFSIKNAAEKEGENFEITVNISEKIIIKNVESTSEVKKALEIATDKGKQSSE